MNNKLTNVFDFKSSIILAVGLIIFAALSRILPHPENFAPIAAIAIFGGAILPNKWAIYLPLSAMILSDLVLGIHSLILFTWGSFALIAFLSSRWLKQINPTNIGIASISASTLFFIVSNLGVWIEGRLYSRTFEGLISCYYNALPFFRNTLTGDLVYTGFIFGAFYAINRYVTHTPATKISTI